MLALLAAAAFGLWRWAAATGSAGTLEWIDARFPRSVEARLATRVQYGAHPAQHLELWLPDRIDPEEGQGSPFPLIVFYHGGGWHSGRPADYRFVARTFAQHGFATALVGYRLVPEGRFPAMLEDSAAAVASVIEVGDRYALATNRIVLAGHSAGAYNAMMLALDPQWLAKAGVPAETVAGVAGLAGPYDFYPFTSESARNALGHVEPPAATQPVAFARGDAPPLLLLTGGDDDVVRPRNSLALDRAMRAAGGRSTVEVFDGMGHAGIIMSLSRPFAQGGRVTRRVATFARERLTPTTSAPNTSAPITSADVQGRPR